jgi:outer membrane receptor for Fe3+-dicitrate
LFNGGEVDVMGLELSVDYDPAEGRDLGVAIPIRLAYTFTSAEFTSGFKSKFGPWGTVEVGDELPYLPEHQPYASVGLNRAKWRVNLTANYVSEMRTVAGQGPIPANQGTDEFLGFGLSAQYAVAPWSSFVCGRPEPDRPALHRGASTGRRAPGIAVHRHRRDRAQQLRSGWYAQNGSDSSTSPVIA